MRCGWRAPLDLERAPKPHWRGGRGVRCSEAASAYLFTNRRAIGCRFWCITVSGFGCGAAPDQGRFTCPRGADSVTSLGAFAALVLAPLASLGYARNLTCCSRRHCRITMRGACAHGCSRLIADRTSTPDPPLRELTARCCPGQTRKR